MRTLLLILSLAPSLLLANPDIILLRGNSAPGRLVDSSVAGNNATLVGAPAWPTNPTPYEGDHWLYQGGDGTNYIQVPVGCVANVFVGKQAIAYRHISPSGAFNMLWDVRQGANVRYDIMMINNSLIDFLFTAVGGGAKEILYNVVLVPGQNYKIQVTSQLNLTTLYVDDTAVGTSAFQMDLGVPTNHYLGCRNDLSQANSGYNDIYMLSTNPNEVFPPASTVPQIQSIPANQISAVH